MNKYLIDLRLVGFYCFSTGAEEHFIGEQLRKYIVYVSELSV